MKRVFRRVAIALLAAASFGCSKPEPEPSLRLHLHLYKTQWRVGEYLWYRIELENRGKKPFPIHDHSWTDRRFLVGNYKSQRDTYLELYDAMGRQVLVDASDRTSNYWITDRTHYPTPIKMDRADDLVYRIRDQVPSWFPNFPFAWYLRHFESYPWGAFVQVEPEQTLPQAPLILRTEFLPVFGHNAYYHDRVFGDRRFKGHGMGFLPSQEGYRVLADYKWAMAPGKYRVQAIFDTREKFPVTSAEEEIEAERHELGDAFYADFDGDYAKKIDESWKKIFPAELADLKKKRAEVEKANLDKPFLKSDFVEFEILP